MRFVLTPTPIEIKGEQREIVRAVFGEDCDVRASEMLAAEQGFDKPGNTKRDISQARLRLARPNTSFYRKMREPAAQKLRAMDSRGYT